MGPSLLADHIVLINEPTGYARVTYIPTAPTRTCSDVVSLNDSVSGKGASARGIVDASARKPRE
jgi:hypothetical protein